MFFLLDKSICINKSFQIDYQNVGELFKKLILGCSYSFAIELVAFDVIWGKEVVNAFFDGALIVDNINWEDEAWIKSYWMISASLNVEFCSEDSTEYVSDYTLVDVV